MKLMGSAIIGVMLVAAPALVGTQAVARDISPQPVGATVTHDPDRTVASRWPRSSETVGTGPMETDSGVHSVPVITVHPAADASASTVRARTPAVRRTVRRGAVLSRAPARRTIDRDIVEQQVVPGLVGAQAYPAQIVVPPSAVTGYPVVYPGVPLLADVPSDAYASTGYPLTSTAGPSGPAGEPYQYTVVGNRVLLVDPATGAVVADVTP